MAKFTIEEFRKAYPSDAACLDKVFKMRYGSVTECPKCNRETQFRRISTRRCYQCRLCYAQFYPTAGTIFEKSRVSLQDWFYIIYLFASTRNGVSSKEIERILGVTYKCAFRMGHQIRKLLETVPAEKLTGVVEMDETYIGGKQINVTGRTLGQKKPVFGMVERLGNVRAYHVPDVKKSTIMPIVHEQVDKKASVNTDDYPLYTNLPKEGFKLHSAINHTLKRYRDGATSTNTIEGYFGQLKRMINGTHIHVSDKYLQAYIVESCFRYNHRSYPTEMFNLMIGQIKPIGF
ncbi:MAG TPA: IS1595 family transposase [Bacteroidia bacterium]|nr:IS1595 family transposase [Bacteroidia bacterium]